MHSTLNHETFGILFVLELLVVNQID